MRRRAARCGCLLVLAALFAVHAGCRSTSDHTGTLAGTVRDAASKTPIDNATVTIGAATAYSDPAGHFTMEELEVGNRSVTVEAPGYQTLTKTVPIQAGDTSEVFELQPLGANDGGATDGPVQQDGGQQDAGQQDAGVCSGNSCTYGYAYGQCCATAQYCVNYSGASSLVCRSTCGAVGERCGYNTDCCNSNCVSGSCAAPSCSGNSCTYGYAYGQCCADAPYCVNYSGASSLVCRSTCGAVGERCGYNTDCCNSNCVSGSCSCAGNSCTYGYAYGQCCAAAPYCVNYNGATSLVCRSTCGAINERCGYNTDCCSSSCVSGYCAAASCTGNACTYGYAYGGCCASQPYCISYYSVAQQTCSATCGAASQHCTYNTDCCSGICTYNSGAGWNTCN